jgi:transposase
MAVQGRTDGVSRRLRLTLALEQKVPTEPADIIALLTSLGVSYGRIGIEAGPLSQWLVSALIAAELPVICVETRHMKALLTAQQINKTDRNDARGIAQMMRCQRRLNPDPLWLVSPIES